MNVTGQHGQQKHGIESYTGNSTPPPPASAASASSSCVIYLINTHAGKKILKSSENRRQKNFLNSGNSLLRSCFVAVIYCI